MPLGGATVSIPTLDFQVWAGSHKVDVIKKIGNNYQMKYKDTATPFRTDYNFQTLLLNGT